VLHPEQYQGEAERDIAFMDRRDNVHHQPRQVCPGPQFSIPIF